MTGGMDMMAGQVDFYQDNDHHDDDEEADDDDDDDLEANGWHSGVM